MVQVIRYRPHPTWAGGSWSCFLVLGNPLRHPPSGLPRQRPRLQVARDQIHLVPQSQLTLQRGRRRLRNESTGIGKLASRSGTWKRPHVLLDLTNAVRAVGEIDATARPLVIRVQFPLHTRALHPAKASQLLRRLPRRRRNLFRLLHWRMRSMLLKVKTKKPTTIRVLLRSPSSECLDWVLPKAALVAFHPLLHISRFSFCAVLHAFAPDFILFTYLSSLLHIPFGIPCTSMKCPICSLLISVADNCTISLSCQGLSTLHASRICHCHP